jgi:hypothetical protein
MTALATTLQAFFTDRLARQRQVSPNTLAAYRDTLRLPYWPGVADIDDWQDQLASLQTAGRKARGDLKRFEQEVTCERLRPNAVAALERAATEPDVKAPAQASEAKVRPARSCLPSP